MEGVTKGPPDRSPPLQFSLKRLFALLTGVAAWLALLEWFEPCLGVFVGALALLVWMGWTRSSLIRWSLGIVLLIFALLVVYSIGEIGARGPYVRVVQLPLRASRTTGGAGTEGREMG